MAKITRRYRIGVDVGGTNTDAALAEASYHNNDGKQPKVKIVNSSKSATTTDVTTGICAAINQLIATSNIAPSDILSVNIGTTHFINAIVQADQTKLRPVAVLRLCGPFCREVVPFTDFPTELRSVLQGPVGYINGGLEIDGRLISDIDDAQVLEFADKIIQAGVHTVVVNGVFSPIDTAPVTQEERVKQILYQRLPGIDVVCSRDVGRLGFLERENAAILNAAILSFGRVTISSFQQAIRDIGLDCPLYLTQNDGTVLDAYSASLTPIRTFSSGATNSLIGALFLSGLHEGGCKINMKENQVIMCDIGGTTSDFAALSPSGLPRQSPATVKVGGVRTAFSMPEVLSIGLGGGSKVNEHDDGQVTVGPLSVGHLLTSQSKCFGGNTLTATDIVVASGQGHKVRGSVPNIGGLNQRLIDLARRTIRKKIEQGIDIIKTSDLPVVLLLVGGGSIILQEAPENVAQFLQPDFSDVANAVGAAIAKISGEIDIIVTPGGQTSEEIKSSICQRAIDLAIENGAARDTVEVLEVDLIPLPYTSDGAVRAVAKAVGELGWAPDFGRTKVQLVEVKQPPRINGFHWQPVQHSRSFHLDNNMIPGYRPNVSKNKSEWILSATDLLFISEGVGVLGTGGGGSVYTTYLNALQVLEASQPGRLRVVDVSSLSPEANIASVAFVGAPSVSNERLNGERELQSATEALVKYQSLKSLDGLLAGEVGGSNGMRAFSVAIAMDIPVVDGDSIGRAFPRIDMSLPYVFKAASPCPAAFSDARGNDLVIANASSARKFESMARSTAIELGLSVAMAMNLKGEVVKKYCVHRTISLSWFIGKAICTARALRTDIVDALISTVRGARKLYSGKVVDVTREVKGGWTMGTVTLTLDDEVKIDSSKGEGPATEARPLQLQYQNEFLYAALVNPDSTLEVVCTTPDLISVLDQDGSAVATHELRYGLRVSVVSMPADPLWKTEEGMAIAGPRGFGIDMDYKEYGVQPQEPQSVIEVYGV
ncbi:hypothetical protein PV10_05911 [Exophiala mesophila]|uniref:Hydantoinase/oxoprolinase n=1 Tax=Exophiala mesophila TaxID=212818 RepID=A0A0D1XT95_EXOME|nr:uncharacterized protein PV10_05911 [Exophiala mesophila]KIV91366.1 hypothetical protein PV10_05911 [Exophiala mesophila]